MEKKEILNWMISEGLIPVIRVPSSQEAVDVANAVKEGRGQFDRDHHECPGSN